LPNDLLIGAIVEVRLLLPLLRSLTMLPLANLSFQHALPLSTSRCIL
jgi:hypothetical protein